MKSCCLTSFCPNDACQDQYACRSVISHQHVHPRTQTASLGTRRCVQVSAMTTSLRATARASTAASRRPRDPRRAPHPSGGGGQPSWRPACPCSVSNKAHDREVVVNPGAPLIRSGAVHSNLQCPPAYLLCDMLSLRCIITLPCLATMLQQVCGGSPGWWKST